MTATTTQKFTVIRVSADLTTDEIMAVLTEAGFVDAFGDFTVEGEAVADLGSKQVEFWFPAE